MEILLDFAHLIDLFITVSFASTILVFFVFLFRYVIEREHATKSREYIKGATRALIALFLMVNMWNILNVIDSIGAFSPITMNALIIFAFFVFGMWSLFGIGDALVDVFVKSFTWLVDWSMNFVKEASVDTPIHKVIMKLRITEYRFIVFFIFIVVLSAILYLL